MLELRPDTAYRFATRPRFAGALALTACLLCAGASRADEGIFGCPFTGTPARLPPSAGGGPIIPASGYAVEDLRGGIYTVTDGTYWAMFVSTGRGVILVDAPPSIGASNLMAAIRSRTHEPLTHLIYSHAHTDHIGAAADVITAAGGRVRIIAQEETLKHLTVSADPRRPLPTETFRDHYLLAVEGQRLELSYHGPQHLAGNIYIYAPRQKVLMAVDLIFPGWTPFKNLALAESVPDFIRAHDDILGFDFDILVAGHLSRTGTRADVALQKQYIQEIRAAAGAALQSISPNAIFRQLAGTYDLSSINTWVFFNAYLQAVATQCAQTIIPAWTDRLGAVDVFTFGHCDRIVDSLRLE